jgi:hypothetical protein
MRELPGYLVAEDFPASLNAKGEQTWDVSKQVLANFSALGIEHLIAIGGDDTLGYAAKLNKLGVKIMAIPKTMDNDVRNTEYCIGFSTAITRAMPSNGSALRLVRMNVSAFFTCSAVTLGLPRSIPHTRPQSAVSFLSTG